MHLLQLTLLFVLFVFCNSRELKDVFADLKGDLAESRDFCSKKASITIDELKIYQDNSKVPENLACFFKCLYEKVGILSEDGIIDVDGLAKLPGYDSNKFGEVKSCLKSMNKVVATCSDLREIGPCFTVAMDL